MADENPNPRPRGRPTKRTAEIDAEIFEALRLGLSRNRTASLVGISLDTLTEWCRNDPDFSGNCHSAESEGVRDHARKIARVEELPAGTASATVTAARFFLSTHDREAFAEKVAVEHSGSITLSDLMRRVVPIDEEPSI